MSARTFDLFLLLPFPFFDFLVGDFFLVDVARAKIAHGQQMKSIAGKFGGRRFRLQRIEPIRQQKAGAEDDCFLQRLAPRHAALNIVSFHLMQNRKEADWTGWVTIKFTFLKPLRSPAHEHRSIFARSHCDKTRAARG